MDSATLKGWKSPQGVYSLTQSSDDMAYSYVSVIFFMPFQSLWFGLLHWRCLSVSYYQVSTIPKSIIVNSLGGSKMCLFSGEIVTLGSKCCSIRKKSFLLNQCSTAGNQVKPLLYKIDERSCQIPHTLWARTKEFSQLNHKMSHVMRKPLYRAVWLAPFLFADEVQMYGQRQTTTKYEPRHENTCLRGLRSGMTKTRLNINRLEVQTTKNNAGTTALERLPGVLYIDLFSNLNLYET